MDTIGRYEIIEKIGFGGTAIVYKARDPKISRTLAIKVLREERCADREYRIRFLREAKAVGILSHPNIVTIYDVGEVNDTPYIAMELIVATTLTLCGSYFYQLQQKTMLTQVYQYGVALSHFIAAENAEPVLSEDWANVELFAQDNAVLQNRLRC